MRLQATGYSIRGQGSGTRGQGLGTGDQKSHRVTASPRHRVTFLPGSRWTVAGSRSAFTLIEVLVAIVIIAVLIALLLPAIGRVRQTARVTQVRTEISALERGIADFKATFGIEPPSSITLYEKGDDNDAMTTDDWGADNRSRALIRRIWPDFNFTLDRDWDNDHAMDGGYQTETHTLTSGECLTFFLGGMTTATVDDPMTNLKKNAYYVGFSKNPSDPFAQGGTRVGPFFEFGLVADGSGNATERFKDLDGDGVVEFCDSIVGQQRPYLYFSSYDGQGYDTTEIPSGTLTDIYRQGPPPNPPAWKAQSFQIISPGFDGEYGQGGLFNPDTATNDLVGNRSAERDNMTNFHSGMLSP